ncbi:MAG: hypothetical protein ACSW8J_02895 [bacterium]
MRKSVFTLWLSSGTLTALRRMAYDDGVSASKIVVDLLELFLEEEGYSLTDEEAPPYEDRFDAFMMTHRKG